MSNTKISIPKPCSYGWDKMTVSDDRKGRHCKACDKVVVDFTKLSTAEIQTFFANYEGGRICGHFNTTDINTPLTWYQKPLVKWYSHIQANYRQTLVRSFALFALGILMGATGCRVTEGDIDVRSDIHLIQQKPAIDSNLVVPFGSEKK